MVLLRPLLQAGQITGEASGVEAVVAVEEDVLKVIGIRDLRDRG